MNFSQQLMDQLNDAYNRRMALFLNVQHDDEDDAIPETDTYDLYQVLIDRSGENGLKSLTRFSINEFQNIYQICEIPLKAVADKKGRSGKLNPRDKLLVTLTYLVTGMKYTQIAQVFDIRLPLLQRSIDVTLKTISTILYEQFVRHNIVPLSPDEKHFDNYPQACGAIDTTLIIISKPKNRDVQRQFWSVKHHACGVKVQALVRPNGICSAVSCAYPGSTHDMTIIRESDWVNTILTYVHDLPNNARVIHHYPCLFDKGYTGINSFYPEAIVTIRKPVGRDLSPEQNEINNRIESDRAIVENFFGRLKTLFGILASRFRGDRDNHLIHILRICISLANYYNTLRSMKIGDQKFKK